MIMSLSRFRLFRTEGNTLGLAPPLTVAGDIICVIHSCPFPVVLRRLATHYQYIGSCFVLGLMDGETAEIVANGKADVQEFVVE